MASRRGPRGSRRTRPGAADLLERNQEIVRRVRSGERVAAVAGDYGLSKWAIYKILPPDVERPGGQGDYPRQKDTATRAHVMALVEDGMTYREIGLRLGISKTRVGQIVADERGDEDEEQAE